MSKIKELADKVAGFRKTVDNKINDSIREIDDAEKMMGGKSKLKERHSYSMESLPEYVKKVAAPKQRRWLAVFNNIFENHGEEKAFRVANAILKEGAVNLEEAAPVGCFEYVSQLIGDALQHSAVFGNGTYPYLMYVFPEKVICGYDGKYYEITYSIDVNDNTTFGKPVEVEQYYAVKENLSPLGESYGKEAKKVVEKVAIESFGKNIESELKEAGISRTKAAADMDLDFDFMAIKEGSYNESTGEVEVVLIEAGTNEAKKRHYPDSTIKEAAANFAGLKMYMNHPTAKQEVERPERDLRDWVSTITESWYEGGKAMGKVAIHDNWLRERLKDPVARKQIGVSINSGGKVSYGKVNGQEMQIVEKIILNRQSGPASVDWVTEAGARGRVSRLLKESVTPTKEKKGMELKEAKFDDLQRENPDLLKSITENVVKSIKESDESKKKEEEFKKIQDENNTLKEAGKKAGQESKIDKWLKDSKLHEAAQSRIKKEFGAKIIDSEKELKESFDARVKEELEYVSKISGGNKGKIRLGESDSSQKDVAPKATELQESLEGRMGIKKEKKEDAE